MKNQLVKMQTKPMPDGLASTSMDAAIYLSIIQAVREKETAIMAERRVRPRRRCC